jgi:hypothetical protein
MLGTTSKNRVKRRQPKPIEKKGQRRSTPMNMIANHGGVQNGICLLIHMSDNRFPPQQIKRIKVMLFCVFFRAYIANLKK